MRENGSFFIFGDVPLLEPPGAIHRDEPAADVAQSSNGLADQPKQKLTSRCGASAHLGEKAADDRTVMPLLAFNRAKPVANRGGGNALAVTVVRMAGRQLT